MGRKLISKMFWSNCYKAIAHMVTTELLRGPTLSYQGIGLGVTYGLAGHEGTHTAKDVSDAVASLTIKVTNDMVTSSTLSDLLVILLYAAKTDDTRIQVTYNTLPERLAHSFDIRLAPLRSDQMAKELAIFRDMNDPDNQLGLDELTIRGYFGRKDPRFSNLTVTIEIIEPDQHIHVINLLRPPVTGGTTEISNGGTKGSDNQ